MFRSPNAGQTALTLQHATSPRSGYKPPAGHNADGYTMAERVTMAKGGRAENPISRTTGKGGNYRKTKSGAGMTKKGVAAYRSCLLYTSPSPRDGLLSRMPSSA